MSEQAKTIIPDEASPERRAHYERISGKAPKRGLTLKEAADYCGLSESSFRTWCKKMGVECRIPGIARYDLKKLDLELDRLTGITPTSNATPTAYQAWKAKRLAEGKE